MTDSIKVEKQTNELWNVDYGGGLEQDFADQDEALLAASVAAVREGRGFVVIERSE